MGEQELSSGCKESGTSRIVPFLLSEIPFLLSFAENPIIWYQSN